MTVWWITKANSIWSRICNEKLFISCECNWNSCKGAIIKAWHWTHTLDLHHLNPQLEKMLVMSYPLLKPSAPRRFFWWNLRSLPTKPNLHSLTKSSRVLSEETCDYFPFRKSLDSVVFSCVFHHHLPDLKSFQNGEDNGAASSQGVNATWSKVQTILG